MKCLIADRGLLIIDRIGAGVGIIMYSPAQNIAAGLHVLAPYSDKPAPVNPIRFANTAIPQTLFQLQKMGVESPSSIAIAGGASIQGMADAADIGPKVLDAVKKAFSKARVKIKLEETGGPKIRTMILNIDAGKIKIA